MIEKLKIITKLISSVKGNEFIDSETIVNEFVMVKDKINEIIDRLNNIEIKETIYPNGDSFYSDMRTYEIKPKPDKLQELLKWAKKYQYSFFDKNDLLAKIKQLQKD